MRKVLFLTLCLVLAVAAVYAKPMQPDRILTALETPGSTRNMPQTRNAPTYEFTKSPTVLLESYYDYMIGSYNSLPFRVIPEDAGGGYFMTYHGQRQDSGSRRVFYVHLSATGDVINQNEIGLVANREGYPTLGVDPISGKPMYAWHANADADPDMLEVVFTSDAFIEGISGLFNEIEIVVDNPTEITHPGGTTDDNEFIWPTIQIGPSPTDGMRRVYVASRNSSSHHSADSPCENLYLAYADFNADMIELGTPPLEWIYTSIPEQDVWNHDPDNLRRPNHAITVDQLGNVYYAGYHNSWDSEDNAIDEPKVDVFKCTNYGAGEWTRVSAYCTPSTWNPPRTLGGSEYLFGEYEDEDLIWHIINSNHLNAVTDNQGRIMFPVLYAVYVPAESVYFPAFHTVKSIVFDSATEELEIVELYPQKHPDDDYNEAFTPWDTLPPWGEGEYESEDDVLPGADRYLLLENLIWPFPHWDSDSHDGSMMFHCNNIKFSEPNEDGLMVAVWQDSQRAKDYNEYPDSYPEYAPYANSPEVYIALSNDNGRKWSEPIIINDVDTPEFAGLTPMWVYPADKVVTTHQDDAGDIYGKFGLMFFDDYTWGSFVIAPNEYPFNDGGAVMFAEIHANFGKSGSSDDPTAPVVTRILNQNYPNPFNPETTISFDMPVAGNARLDIYNVKGQRVKTLFNGAAPSGRTSMVWDGTDSKNSLVGSGIYFYRLRTDKNSETRKMMLMK